MIQQNHGQYALPYVVVVPQAEDLKLVARFLDQITTNGYGAKTKYKLLGFDNINIHGILYLGTAPTREELRQEYRERFRWSDKKINTFLTQGFF